ncbi:MAG: hypothetical protein ACPIOQ_01905 [Promethearchaeia archaeon]
MDRGQRRGAHVATPCARSCALVLIGVLALAIDVVSQHVSLARPLKGERLEAREVAEQFAHARPHKSCNAIACGRAGARSRL